MGTITIPMRSLAELKRAIKPAVKIRLIETNCITRVTNADGKHKYLNVIRTVTKAQTNSFAMATDEQLAQGKAGSWMDYPKSDMVWFGCNGVFKFLFDYPKSAGMGMYRDYFTYEIV